MSGDRASREPDRPQRVIPVTHQLRDGPVVDRVELWDDRVVLCWTTEAPSRADRYIVEADDYAPVEPPWGWDDNPGGARRLLAEWTLIDDVGTVYESHGGASGGGEEGWSGKVTFEPSPPAHVKLLRFRLDDDEVSVSPLSG